MAGEPRDPKLPRPEETPATPPEPGAPASGISRLQQLKRAGVTAAERAEMLGSPAVEPAPRATEADQLQRLLDVSLSLVSIREPEVLLAHILDHAVALVGAERGMVLQPDGQSFRVLHARGGDGTELAADRLRISRTLARRCVDTDSIVVWDGIEQYDGTESTRSITELDLRRAVCVPLRLRGRVTGVLYVDSRTGSFLPSSSDRRLLEGFAAHAAMALVNAAQFQELEESRLLLARENESLRDEVRQRGHYAGLIGQSPVMLDLYEKIRLLRDAMVSVVLLGPSGSGKGVVARALHAESARGNRPFVSLNCGSGTETLIESKLFGHMKGSFTGAVADSPGLIEQADGGTLFLDEIGEITADLQVRLLTFLGTGIIRRIGDTRDRMIDVRVIAATHRDLEAMVRDGRFREDLYYRLGTVRIQVPPLAARREDIPLLIESIFAAARPRSGRTITGITERAQRLLLSYDWPGNVRELENVIDGACAFVPDGSPLDEVQIRIQLPKLPAQLPPVVDPGVPRSLADAVRESERACLVSSLERHRWNITRAAGELDISRQHLHNLIRSHGLHRPGSESSSGVTFH